MKMNAFRSIALGLLAAVPCVALVASAQVTPRDPRPALVSRLVLQVQRADYEGDRPALKRLHEELLPFSNDKDFGVKVRYWSAFALWRRSINGFNDGIARPELQADLQQAVAEFTEASEQDPAFADAKIGALGCASLLGYILIENGAQMQDAEVQELLERMRQWLRPSASASIGWSPLVQRRVLLVKKHP